MNKIIFVLVIFYFNGALLQFCKQHKTCRDCIRDSKVCVWCASKTYDNEQRCKPKSIDSNSTWCPDSLQNPDNTKNTSKDDPFNSDPKNVTQIKPQRYQMSLRPGKPQNFSFSFKWAQDYPVELYFLFDTSNSMNVIRNVTSQQSENIYKTMLNMTRDVSMGVGTFVDKNMLPFTKYIASNSAYSYRHRLNLTHEYNTFQKAVEDIPQGENRDYPEGGLEALAQAMACKDVIGWKDQSRKIVILMTDGPLHGAGDGKSAGLFKPYNGSCFTKNNVYTKELEMDYPSVGMISKLARDNNIVVIFAVTNDMKHIYSKLTNYVTGSKLITLEVNGDDEIESDIVIKLREIYEEISTKMKIIVNMQTGSSGSARRKNFDITFDPDCTKNLDTCIVTRNDIKYINGSITLLNYEGYDKAKIDIAVEGIAEKLTLDIDVINSCECEQDVEEDSTYCSHFKRECGICQCEDPWYGSTCQCMRGESVKNDTSTCKMGNMTKDCSGNGICSCGKCLCQSRFAGPYCECYNKDCPLTNKGVLCGHGVCQCDGTCQCHPGWTGDACECYDTEKYCMAPSNKICSNHGKCDCGKCKCHAPADWDKRKEGFTGDYCVAKPCPECHSLQCKTLNHCALCLLDVKECNDCTFIHNLTIYDKLPDNLNHSDNNADWHICNKISLDMGCYTKFAYKYADDPYGIHLMLQTDQNCVESYYIYGGIVLLCVLLVGIFTLLGWKLITYLRDRQEYLQFMKNHALDTDPCINPLYEPATTTFRNPAFRKRSIQH